MSMNNYGDRNDRYSDRDRDSSPQSPSSDNYDHDDEMMDDDGDPKGGRRQYDMDKDRKMFSRKKTCWFCAKKTEPDWKDPHSYAWLVNEFGKISPSRISGLCSSHQRHATTAIKRGRNMCLIGHITNHMIQ